MYLLAFCCDHLYPHVTIPLIEYPREFEQRFTIIHWASKLYSKSSRGKVELLAEIIMVKKRDADIKKPWCENRDFSRIQDLLRRGVNAHESL
jgi:hypothetical protein